MTPAGAEPLFGLVAALGGGLLVGVERERHKAQHPQHEPAGVRSFIVVALIGCVAAMLGPIALGIAGAAISAMAFASYWHSLEHDPGLTTEFALLASFLLGGLAQSQPQLGAALFVVLAVLLQSKQSLHHFTLELLSERELDDALLLAGSALVVLPLLPDHPIDPWEVLNPRKLWLFAVLIMAINSLGYIALRSLGRGRGLAIAGLLGGFVSSSATIAGMGQRAASDPGLVAQCVAAALLSCIATTLQLALILVAIAPALFAHLAWPLSAAGVTAFAVSGWFLWHGRAHGGGESTAMQGRPFALGQALLFAGIVAVSLLLSHALHLWFGAGGIIAAAAVAGFADVHAAAVTLGQLVSGSDVSAHQAAFALAAAFTANSAVKCIAAIAGGVRYARPVILGVVMINGALVAATWLN